MKGFSAKRETLGFTLMEILVVMAVSVIVSALLITILVRSSGVFYKQTVQISEGVGINNALSRLREVTKGAQSVEATSSASELVLKIPTITNNNDFVENTFDSAVFTKDNDKLRYKLFPNSQSSRKLANEILTSSIDNFILQYYDKNDQVVVPVSATKIKMTLVLKNKIATTEASLRND